MWKERKKYGIIFAGAVLYAFSVALILKPNQLAPGGASGLAIMISYFTGIKTGTIYSDFEYSFNHFRCPVFWKRIFIWDNVCNFHKFHFCKSF